MIVIVESASSSIFSQMGSLIQKYGNSCEKITLYTNYILLDKNY